MQADTRETTFGFTSPMLTQYVVSNSLLAAHQPLPSCPWHPRERFSPKRGRSLTHNVAFAGPLDYPPFCQIQREAVAVLFDRVRDPNPSTPTSTVGRQRRWGRPRSEGL
jgi:hypothetical protein